MKRSIIIRLNELIEKGNMYPCEGCASVGKHNIACIESSVLLDKLRNYSSLEDIEDIIQGYMCVGKTIPVSFLL